MKTREVHFLFRGFPGLRWQTLSRNHDQNQREQPNPRVSRSKRTYRRTTVTRPYRSQISEPREIGPAMKGLIEEGSDGRGCRTAGHGCRSHRTAQRVEHYEMAGYGTVHNFSELLGEKEAARIF